MFLPTLEIKKYIFGQVLAARTRGLTSYEVEAKQLNHVFDFSCVHSCTVSGSPSWWLTSRNFLFERHAKLAPVILRGLMDSPTNIWRVPKVLGDVSIPGVSWHGNPLCGLYTPGAASMRCCRSAHCNRLRMECRFEDAQSPSTHHPCLQTHLRRTGPLRRSRCYCMTMPAWSVGKAIFIFNRYFGILALLSNLIVYFLSTLSLKSYAPQL
ncbi:hypothetical protein JB92DRAFT_1752701 [Gautieria morchelliformis]|nr:hypothetical protein JB92DRAFT_1752701 [Gautieria morchelliformis]